MQKPSIQYLHLTPEGELAPLPDWQRFKAVLVLEEALPEMMMWEICRTLVTSGCSYVLAWGTDCVSWQEAIDDAFLEATAYEDVPDAQRILSTSHEDEDLEEVFWFANHRALHPAHELRDTLILHLAAAPRREELEASFRAA